MTDKYSVSQVSVSKMKRSNNIRKLIIAGKVLLILIKFTILLLIGYKVYPSTSGSVFLLPHTSVGFPLSGLYCGSLSLSREVWDNSEAAKAWDAAVYILPQEPEYNKTVKFTIANGNVTFPAADGVRWYTKSVHLHKGSSFTINSCFTQGNSTLWFGVVKSKKKYRNWESGPSRDLEFYSRSLDDCTSNFTRPTIIVSEDSMYYFIHYTKTNKAFSFQVHIDISSAEFDDGSAAPNGTCSNFHRHCTFNNSIPIDFRGFALVTAIIGDNKRDWSYEDSIKVSWSCSDTTFLPYFLVVGIPMIAVFSIYFVAVCYCCFFCKCCDGCARCSTKKRKGGSWSKRRICFILILVNVVLFFPIAATFTFLEGGLPILARSSTPSPVLIPGATQSFPVNKFYCSSMSMSIRGSSHLSASLYWTNTTPSLPDHFNTKTVSEVVSCDGTEGCLQFWRTQMKENSSLSLTAYTSGEAYFLAWDIKGVYSFKYDFDDFLSDPEAFIKNNKFVVNEKIQENFTYHNSLLNGEFIFIIFSHHSSVDVTLKFNLSEYSIPFGPPACEVHSYMKTECKTSIPYGIGKTNAIVKVSKDGEDTDDSFEYLTVDTDCNLRSSAWMAICLPLFIVNYVLFFPLFLLCVTMKARIKMLIEQNQGERQPLLQQQRIAVNSSYHQTTSALSDTVSSVASPLPVNSVATKNSKAESRQATGEVYQSSNTKPKPLLSNSLLNGGDSGILSINESGVAFGGNDLTASLHTEPQLQPRRYPLQNENAVSELATSGSDCPDATNKDNKFLAALPTEPQQEAERCSIDIITPSNVSEPEVGGSNKPAATVPVDSEQQLPKSSLSSTPSTTSPLFSTTVKC